ncbi:hypothetical protein AB0C59_04320 [Streptomyces sp. NPDC048664]|uniref:hypothetical protein n=1 Tax=Streptomyces sp. NPDC048664 TaxID=3154505 RepID=UPI00343DEBAE
MRAREEKKVPRGGSHVVGAPAGPLAAVPLADLQRTAGNAAVTRALRTGSLPHSAGLGRNTAAGVSAAVPVQRVETATTAADTGTSAAAAGPSYRMQIQVSKPASSYEPAYWAGRFGHAWVAIYTTEGGRERVKTFGFYPQENVRGGNPLRTVRGGVHKNKDEPDKASARYTVDLTLEQYENAMQYIDDNHAHSYNLAKYNCTSFARGVYAAATGGAAPNVFGIPLDNPNLLQDGIKRRNERAGKPRKGEDIDAPLIDSSPPSSDSESDGGQVGWGPPEGGLVAVPGMVALPASEREERFVIE